MYKITITKVKEAEEQTITRKYDDGCTDEVFEEAVIEMIDQLKDNRTMEDIINLRKEKMISESIKEFNNNLKK